MKIGRLAVRNPVLVNILMIVVLVLGAFSALRLPQEQFSEIPFFFVNIIVPYPGVAAEDVEKSVTVPVEDEMQGLERLSSVRSTVQDGLTVVTLEFDQGISNDEFESLLEEARNRFRNIDLPDDVGQETIDDFSTNDFLPVIEVVLSGNVPYGELNRNAEELESRIRRISDVSGVTLVGSRDRQVLVDVKQRRLEILGLSISDVVQSIRGRNVSIPAGTAGAGSREYLLRTVGEVEDYRTLERTVVRAAGGGVVRLGDVATISQGYADDGVYARYNGEPSIALDIAKVPGGSSVEIVNEARRVVEEMRGEMPEGIEVAFLNDSTVQIRDSLNVLLTNALLGLGLVVFVLLLFVGLRNALMTAIGIPISFAITFIILEALGETLNSNTLFGLVLVLGLLVDHAIVIVENSYRLQQEGLSKREAAIQGVDQVIGPVVAATATTIAAFLPLTFLPGVIGEFLAIVPVTVAVALAASNFEAGFILPSHYADWPGGGKAGSRSGVFQRLTAGMQRVISPVYRYRGVAFALAIIASVGVFSLVPRIQVDLFDAEDFSLFFIEIEMPPGTPIEQTADTTAKFESRMLPLIGNGEVAAVDTAIGFTSGQTENTRQPNVAQITVDLLEQDEGRERSIEAIIDEVDELVAGIAGPEDVRFRKQQNGPPTDPPLVFRLFGDDYDDLTAVSRTIKRRLDTKDGVFNIRDNLENGTPELRVQVDEDAAAGYGLSTEQVGTFIRASFDGITATTIFAENQKTDVVVRYDRARALQLTDLMNLKIPSPTGRQIPFGSVASIGEAQSFASIQRLDGKREVQIEADASDATDLQAMNQEIQALFDEELAAQFPNVELEIGGEFAAFTDLLVDIIRVFLIGVFLIYTILAAQFKSYTQPILILFTIPFAFVGVVLFLIISGTPLSTIVIYAGIALVGIAVNDAIVLISFINDLRKEGVPHREAVERAVRTRVRPVLLTSLTTIAGLIPTAIGIGGYSVVWGPMAATITFGLIFSTASTLILIPSIYGLFYDHPRRGTESPA
jgi:multidrug efflux pump subunit AcrB